MTRERRQPFSYFMILASILLGAPWNSTLVGLDNNSNNSAKNENRVSGRAPNIVYIMSDELAYYEVGFNGSRLLRTPRIDRLAREGIIFTNALAAAPVCAPLRACLMTGKHAGHCSVRANDGGTPLRQGEPTIASMLKSAGYATGGFGKWGAGGRDSTGVPEKHGFDEFFGYYDQVHAHSFYPPYLIRNSEEVPLPGNVGGRSGQTYSHYEIMKRGLKFIRDNKDRPFFCYLPITPPHGMYDIPDSDPAWKLYKDKPGWPEEAKRYAAMVTMVDRNVGEVLDLLRELNLDEQTIVFFSGDNGGQDRFKTPDRPRGFFGPNVHPETGVEFRGGKGSLYEGGLRIPFAVRWPGKIKPGQTSDLIWSQVDVFPTLAKLLKSAAPEDLDGISILPTLIGEQAAGETQTKHEMLYWEYRDQVAVRFGKWKAILPGRKKSKWELYDLANDISETTDISAEHPEILKKMQAFAKSAHTPVQPGSYTTRVRHERDRWAKWGTSKPPAPKLKSVVKWNRKGLLDSADFRIVRVSSENRGNGRLISGAFDNDPRTWWHSKWDADPKKSPHEIVIDLGSEKTIRGIRYLSRQDGSFNGAIARLKLEVLKSLDQKDGQAVETTFKKTRAVQEFRFEPIKGRYVRVLPLTEVNGKPWASAAEIGLIGK